MLRRARRFLIGATVYGVLECPTFAVCLWVVHLEPHLLDNMGPLTRDTAVCRGASLTRGLPRTLSNWHATPRTGQCIFLLFKPVTSDFTQSSERLVFERLTCFLCRCRDSRLFVYSIGVKQEKSLVKEPRFVETRGAIARAQAKRIGENSIKSWCMRC